MATLSGLFKESDVNLNVTRPSFGINVYAPQYAINLTQDEIAFCMFGLHLAFDAIENCGTDSNAAIELFEVFEKAQGILINKAPVRNNLTYGVNHVYGQILDKFTDYWVDKNWKTF